MSVRDASVPVPTGNALGKYRLVASLGQGGMADVYLAVAEGPAGVTKLQVLKRLRAGLAEEPEFLAMFLDEARLAARLNHPNVVQTNEVGQVGDAYFLAMEYLDGQPLNRILHVSRSRPAPPGLALRIVADALSGLHYAHELCDYDGTLLGIVHRDTSPHNIFTSYSGQTKLVDFGIAKAARRTSETSVGIIKGKFMYMSPEQARCAPLDRRSDIFVMGLVVWEIVAGHRMWKGRGDAEIVASLVNGEIPSLRGSCPDAPEALIQICDRALALRVEDRYATAAEMRAEILAHLAAIGADTSIENVSAYLIGAFAERRAEMQKIIEAQLRRLAKSPDITAVSAHDPPPSSSLPELGSFSVRSESDITPSRSRGHTGTPLASSPAPAPISAVSSPTGRPSIYVGAAVIAALGLYAAFGRRAPAPAALPRETAPVVSAPSPVAATSAPIVGRLELKIAAEPPDARVFLDDAALPSNPFIGKFTADGLSHRLRVEASGYGTRSQIVVFEKDTSLQIVLAPTASAAASPAKGVPSRPEGAPATATVTATATAAPPSPAPSAPGKDRRKLDDPWEGDGPKAPSAPKRALDSAEPWR